MAKVAKEALQATEVLFELILAHKRLFHAIAKANGLSPQQAATITHLEPGEGMPMNALAELLMCDASNVTGIIDKLEARGLAKREQGEDRRVKVLTLTEAGIALRNTMRARVMQPPTWLLNLSREDQVQLNAILQRAKELFSAEEP
jgi:DNA-binding MarR family transcriptional regulator